MRRRDFMAGSSAWCLLGRSARGQTPSSRALVVVFLRGGLDGLAMVPPSDERCQALRRNVHPQSPLPLNSDFGLHPSLEPVLPLFRSGALAVVHAVGQLRPSRSHFDAQDFLESGLAGERAADGWLNRAMITRPESGHPFDAVAVQNGVPWSLRGPSPIVAFPALKDFRVAGSGADSFEQLYAAAVDEALKVRGAEAFAGLEAAQGLSGAPARNGAQYPSTPLGRRLRDVARLIHAGVGLRVAVTEAAGFDTHLGQAPALAARLKDLGESLAAFATDLGARLRDVCLTTVTEFGRTAKENGTRGTDHGTASAMLVLGGAVKGGAVHCDWPGLSASELFEGRDLRVTLDVRAVLAELLAAHLEIPPGVALPNVAPSRVLFG